MNQEEKKTFRLWTLMTLWAVIGSLLLTWFFMVMFAHNG